MSAADVWMTSWATANSWSSKRDGQRRCRNARRRDLVRRASGARSQGALVCTGPRIFSHVVLELGLGVERLRGRRGDRRGRGRRRGASSKSGEKCAGGEDAKAFGHLRVFPILTGVGHVASGAGSIAERRDSINSVLPIGRSANPIALYVLGAAMRKIEEAARISLNALNPSGAP